MPIYEYECRRCREFFEELVFGAGDEFVRCPKCGARNVERQISATYSLDDESNSGCFPKGLGGFG